VEAKSPAERYSLHVNASARDTPPRERVALVGVTPAMDILQALFKG